MEEEANDDISSILAICLELTAMAGACEDDPVIKDFLLSAYSSPLCLSVIRRNDAQRAKEVFKDYCSDWSDEQFAMAEVLVSGIEFATLMTAGDSIPLETRIFSAIETILGIYGVPEDVCSTKLEKVYAMDYRNIGKKAFMDFRKFVEQSNDRAFRDLLKR